MSDHLSEGERSWNMSRIRSKNTTPELAVRRVLTQYGLRYRLHVRSLPGNPDIVMRKIKTTFFVNGCFWHQHEGCSRSTSPKTNRSYWGPKLKRNVIKQKSAITELKKKNWKIVTVWECETKSPAILESKLIKALAE